jgi:hypothetical protein
MSNGAPVCPISRDQAVPGQPGLRLPPVPRALDLPSLIQAVNTIRNVLTMISIGPVTNNIYPPRPFGYPQLARQNTAAKGGSGGIVRGWQEIRRVTEEQEINHSEQEMTPGGEMQISKENPEIKVFVERFKRIKYQSNPGAGSLDNFEWVQKHNPEEDYVYGSS